jgi:cytochrome c peroxidase
LEPRNTPTVFNVAFNADENGNPSHRGIQFMDGRVNGLEELVDKPIADRVEMRGDAYPGTDEEAAEAALDSVIARLLAIPEYVQRLRDAFPIEAAEVDSGIRASIIDSSTYARGISAYVRELVTRNSPYDRYVKGDDNALDDIQKKGLELFFTKAKCATCHSGPMFSDFGFIVQGVPQEGTGKKVIPGDDTGREEHTKNPADRYAFRTLSLRNVELTPPYMHDGVFETLEEVVRFYNDGAQPRHPNVTDDMLDPTLIEPLGLTDGEINALVEFMKALTDAGSALPSFLVTVPEIVPSGLMPVFGVRGLGSGRIAAGPSR